MILTGGTKELGENSVPVPLCPPHAPCGLTWARTPASVMEVVKRSCNPFYKISSVYLLGTTVKKHQEQLISFMIDY
jgi:hypothetical protein